MIAPPRPPADPEALIPEARERQRRRQLIVAAAVVVTAGLGLAVYAVVGGLGQNETTDGSPRAGVPSCRSSRLSGSFTPGGGAGTILGAMLIRNTGRTACALPVTQPAVHVTFRNKPLTTTEKPWPAAESFGRSARVLAPGAAAYLEIGWSDACQRLTTSAPQGGDAGFVVRFADGLRLAVPETPPDRSVVVPGCNGAAMQPTPSLFVSAPLRA